MRRLEPIAGCPGLARFAVRTPTLLPATHTNTYVVGERDVLVVDPGSPYDEERAAFDAALDEALAAWGTRVQAIVITHHHFDHIGGAAHLAARLGVPVWGHAGTAEHSGDRLRFDRLLVDGERLRAGDAELEVLFTPGHSPGHLCFLERSTRAVLAGDMVATVGTIVVNPPEGDMRQYLASLARLQSLDARVLLPSHGEPVTDPAALLGFYVRHRLEREGKVVAALAAGSASLEELVPRAYPELAPAIYPLAARSLLAHLYKLQAEGRATVEGDRWSAA